MSTIRTQSSYLRIWIHPGKPLKIGRNSKRKLIFPPSIFRCEPLVSGKVLEQKLYFSDIIQKSKKCRSEWFWFCSQSPFCMLPWGVRFTSGWNPRGGESRCMSCQISLDCAPLTTTFLHHYIPLKTCLSTTVMTILSFRSFDLDT